MLLLLAGVFCCNTLSGISGSHCYLQPILRLPDELHQLGSCIPLKYLITLCPHFLKLAVKP